MPTENPRAQSQIDKRADGLLEKVVGSLHCCSGTFFSVTFSTDNTVSMTDLHGKPTFNSIIFIRQSNEIADV